MDRKRFKANEQRERIFAAQGFMCGVCGKSIYAYNTPQLAHRVKKSVYNLRTYGPEIIHHRLNLVAVCCLECNGKVSIDGRPIEKNFLIEAIRENLKENE